MQNAVAVKNQLCLAQDKLTMFKTQKFLPTDQDTSYKLFMMKNATRDPILIALELNEVPFQMELDTGASLTLINRL